MILTVIIFIILLSILVLIHEGGHFLAAKKAGIEVEEFGLGLPPRILGFNLGGTIYSLNWLPFGGFVKLVGEDPTDPAAQSPGSFYTKSLKARSSVVLAGVVANFFLGVVLFYLVLAATSFKVDLPLFFPHQFKFVTQQNGVAVTGIEKASPAEFGGVKIGDAILSVDGKIVANILQLRGELSQKKGKEVTLILRNIEGTERQVRTTLRTEGEGLLGVSLAEFAHLEYASPPQKIFSGLSHSANIIEYSGKIFGGLIAQAISQGTIQPISVGVAGPIGIAQITSQIVSLGILPTLQFGALLSLNLAVINILPFPALDGGRLAFLAIEAVTRRRLNPKIEKWANSAGFAVLLVLILVITYNDLLRIFR